MAELAMAGHTISTYRVHCPVCRTIIPVPIVAGPETLPTDKRVVEITLRADTTALRLHIEIHHG